MSFKSFRCHSVDDLVEVGSGIYYRTPSGRQTRYSEKTRESMFEKAERFYRCELVSFKRLTTVLRGYLDDKVDVESVKCQFAEWLAQYTRVRDSIGTLKSYSLVSEWLKLEPDIRTFFDICNTLRKRSFEYIGESAMEFPEMPITSKEDRLSVILEESTNLNDEIKSLQAEVDRLEVELSTRTASKLIDSEVVSPSPKAIGEVKKSVPCFLKPTSAYKAPVLNILSVSRISSLGPPRYQSSPFVRTSVATSIPNLHAGGYTTFVSKPIPSVTVPYTTGELGDYTTTDGYKPFPRTRILAKDFSERYSSRYQDNDELLSKLNHSGEFEYSCSKTEPAYSLAGWRDARPKLPYAGAYPKASGSDKPIDVKGAIASDTKTHRYTRYTSEDYGAIDPTHPVSVPGELRKTTSENKEVLKDSNGLDEKGEDNEWNFRHGMVGTVKKSEDGGKGFNSETMQIIKGLAEAFMSNSNSNLRTDKLPRLEPDVYTGQDVLNFPIWWNSFKNLIEKTMDSNSERLFYLGKYTSKDAYDCVKCYLHLVNDDGAYLKAKKALMKNYGTKIKIAEAYRSKMASWQVIAAGDAAGLRKYSNFLWQCHAAASSIGYLDILSEQEENVKMCAKLPFRVSNRWNRHVVERTSSVDDTEEFIDCIDPDQNINETIASGQYPSFLEFCQFVEKEAKIASGPCARTGEKDSAGQGQKAKRVTLRTEASTVKTSGPVSASNNSSNTSKVSKANAKPNKCYFCKKLNHCLDLCPDFAKRPEEERKAFLKQVGVCFGCMRRKHKMEDCKRKNNPMLVDDSVLTIAAPGLPTNTMGEASSGSGKTTVTETYHTQYVSPPVSVYTANTSVVPKAPYYNPNYTTTIPVYVWRKGDPVRYYRIYAMLDSQSNSCFISEVTRNILYGDGAQYSEADIKLSTMGHSYAHLKTTIHDDLMITGYRSGVPSLELPKCFSRPEVPCDKFSIPRVEEVTRHQHLAFLKGVLYPMDSSMEVGLLIGYNCPAAFVPLECVTDPEYPLTSPFAVRTALGWCVSGPSESYGDEPLGTKELFSQKTNCKEITLSKVCEAFDIDLSFRDECDVKVSYEDTCFLRLMKERGYQDYDAHIVLPLPVRTIKRLPDSRNMAYRRLMSLKRKLLRDPVLLKRYQDFMVAMFAENQVEAAPALDVGNDRFWYLPHQGVYHPKKPNKLRVVFDGSAECQGMCLNTILTTGPDLCNNLAGVLCRFREDRVAFTCDIKGMFLQVRVRTEDRDLLRFYWFEDHDPLKRVLEFRITVHLFGAVSSPTCATYALRLVADRYAYYYGQDIANFIHRNFYVDDGLKSVKNEEEALRYIHASRAMCQSGGFTLHQFSSTSKKVMSMLPAEIRTKDMYAWSMPSDLPSQLTLGCELSLEKDVFMYNFALAQVCTTRRQMLSALSMVYDPLGMVSAAVLPGRHILQNLCRAKCGWDETVGEEVIKEWNSWYHELKNLSEIKIERCFLGSLPGYERVQVHIFSDASEVGYGVCAYLTLIHGTDVHTSLIMAKSRVTPVRTITIPRLELQAAILAVRAMEFLKRELPYECVEYNFWVDSKIVLAYIANVSKRFLIFVANRIQYIRDRTTSDQWRYVPSNENPADIASRGIDAGGLVNSAIWWRGPLFLGWPNRYPAQETVPDVVNSDPEVRVMTLTTQGESQKCLQWISRYSSWVRILKTVAWWCKLFDKLKKVDCSYVPILRVVDMIRAQECIFRWLQEKYFSQELQVLKSDAINRRKQVKDLPSKSFMHNLTAYVDASGLIRVGGRLNLSRTLSLETVHPIILPGDHPVVHALIFYYHAKTAHSGRNTTVNSIRTAGLWILRLRRTADTIIKGCIICKKIRGKISQQQMAPLPMDRITPCSPFTHCGVDFFGPFFVKDKRSVKKRWACLFTCLVMRAIHIEVTPDMTTSSFINAYRRFIARRGPVRTLRCDRGTNIMGSRSELDLAVYSLNHEVIQQTLLAHQCDWVVVKPNPPKASEMGGIWERMIRSVRNVLSALLVGCGTQLDDDALHTFLVEAEAIVNSRPLSVVDLSDPEANAISPSTLLTLKPRNGLPPMGCFVRQDLYARNRWRAVQFMADQFWIKWSKEYLPLLNARAKWIKRYPNLQVDDVVLLLEDAVPRSQWPMGKIVSVVYSADGLVRSLRVRTQTGVYDRTIRKVVFLLRPSDFYTNNP